MNWFMLLPTEVQIAIVGIGGSALTIVGVIVREHFSKNSSNSETKEHNNEFRRPSVEIKLSEHDRDLLRRHGDTLKEHGEEVGKLREEVMMWRATARPPPRNSRQ